METFKYPLLYYYSSKMDGIEEILLKVGLTKQESKTYLALLRLQESQTGKLCKETNIASSNIYKILDGLIRKGLVSYKIQNNIKIFMPAPIETLNELFLEKQNKLEEERKEISNLIDKMKKKPAEKESYSNYKYYEGLIGVKSMWNEINLLLKNGGEERVYGGKKEAYEKLLDFYNEHHKIRNKLKINTKILVAEEDVSKIKKRRENKNTKVKFGKVGGLAEWGVVDDIVYIQHIVTNKPHGFLIKDKIFADTFKEVFDGLWGQAKR